MYRVQFVYSFALLAVLVSQICTAATVRVDQHWNDLNSSTGRTAVTTAIFDDSGFTGIGYELTPLTYFGMATYTNGIGQNFNLADFPDPPSLTAEGNIAAGFRDGVFEGLGNVALGGSARIAMVNGNPPFGGAGSLNIAGNELIWHLPVSGEIEYRLQTTAVTYPQPSPVPLPAAIWLFAPALLGLGGLRRRAARLAPAPLAA